MEIITKIQEELFNSYNNDQIGESELIHEIKYVKEVHADMTRLKQSMIDKLDVPMDELCNTKDIVSILSTTHKQLMGKYGELKSILGTSNTPDDVDDEDDVERYEDEECEEDDVNNTPTDDTPTDDEDTDDTHTEDMRNVSNMIRYHTQLMDTFNNEDITSKLFVSNMTDACDLSKPIYKGIVRQTRELLKELTSYPAISTQWKVMKCIDVSNIVIRGLYMSEYGKHEDEELEELFAKYIVMLKETVGTATSRCMATPISWIRI